MFRNGRPVYSGATSGGPFVHHGCGPRFLWWASFTCGGPRHLWWAFVSCSGPRLPVVGLLTCGGPSFHLWWASFFHLWWASFHLWWGLVSPVVGLLLHLWWAMFTCGGPCSCGEASFSPVVGPRSPVVGLARRSCERCFVFWYHMCPPREMRSVTAQYLQRIRCPAVVCSALSSYFEGHKCVL